MTNKILLLVTLLSSLLIFSQNYEEQDLFDQTKGGHLVIKPTIDREIRAKIEPIVQKKLEDLIKNPKDEFSKISGDQIEFVKDTLTINNYLEEYQNYQASGTTFGMNIGIDFRNMEYDKLLNKYYKKSLEILQPDMKKQLINSQRKWLEYYTNEKTFISNMMNFGNHNYVIYASEFIDKIILDRVQFLVDVFEGKMQGTSTYKEN